MQYSEPRGGGSGGGGGGDCTRIRMGILTNTLGISDVDCTDHSFRNIRLETGPRIGPQKIVNIYVGLFHGDDRYQLVSSEPRSHN